MTLMGPTPWHSQRQVAFACQSIRLVAPFFFLAKVPFFAFLKKYKSGVAIEICLCCTPDDTDSIYMGLWV